jgi:aldehyde dehydrogenase (NAD+)
MSSVTPGPPQEVVTRLRDAQARERIVPVAARCEALRRIRAELLARLPAIYAAARADLNKPEFETLMTEVNLCRDEARLMERKLPRWTRPRRVAPSWVTWPSRAQIVPEPRGVVLVIGTWNYPLRLTLGPVLAAIAAGNRVVVKPSERAPAMSGQLRELLAATVPPDLVTVVEGDHETAQALLREQFDLVFYTGGSAVGRLVMQAAAANGTPTVLELGGKSPCIVDATAKLDVAAKRIAWGKFLNAGQTCIAPDFVCVHESVRNQFLALLTAEIRRSYPSQAVLERDYSRMVSQREYERFRTMGARPDATRFGDLDESRLLVPPTLIPEVTWDDPVMQGELFGPVLPVVAYRDREEVTRRLADLPSPLTVYLFSESRESADYFRARTASGAFVVNDVIRHLSNLRLPFGGVGGSGFGAYHGRHGFEAFSHLRAEMQRSTRFSLFETSPPYGEFARRVMRWLS